MDREPASAAAFSIKHILRVAWRSLDLRFVCCFWVASLLIVLSFIGFLLIATVLIPMATRLNVSPEMIYPVLAALVIIAAFLLIPWSCNIAWMGVRHLRGETVFVHDVFLDYQSPLRLVVGICFVSGSFAVLDRLLHALLTYILMSATWYWFGLVLGMVMYFLMTLISIRFSFFPYLILGKSFGVLKALSHSFLCTERYAWKLLLTLLLLMLLLASLYLPFWLYPSPATTLISLILVACFYPYICLIYAAIYQHIFQIDAS